MQSKELWSGNTQVIGFDRECFFQHFGRCQQDQEIWWMCNNSKGGGCNARTLIQKGLLQTLLFTSNLTLTSSPLLGNGLQNKSRKSIDESKDCSEILKFVSRTLSMGTNLWTVGHWLVLPVPQSISIWKPWSCRPLVSHKGLYKLLKTLFLGFGNGYTV